MSKAKPVVATLAAATPDLGEELDKVAQSIVVELQGAGVILEEKVAAFKALSAYYAMRQKLPPPPDESKGQFGGNLGAVKTHRNGVKLNSF